MSQNHRVTFSADGGERETVVIKLASDDATSRATGVGMGAYFREIAFYRNLAGRIGGPLPTCHLAEYDPAEGWFTLVLRGRRRRDARATRSPAARSTRRGLALTELARIHAPVLGDLALGTSDWLNQPNPLNGQLLTALLPGFLERYADRIAPEHAEVCKRFVPVVDAWAADARPPLGLVHGDYRLDNLLFGERHVQGRGLADRHLGPGDGRRRLLHRRRAADRRPARPRGGARPRLPRRTARARRRGLLLGAVLGGVPPRDVPRDPHDGRGVDGRACGPTAATTCS